MKIDLIIAGRRLRNRILDLIGRLAGYCMADTWQDETDQHGPRYAGYSHWRCWVKRADHRGRHGPILRHRFNNHRWRPGGETEFAPIPVTFLDDPEAGFGSPPAWARRWPHAMVAPRRRERAVADYLTRTMAARRAQADAVRRSVEAAAVAAREASLDRILSETCPHGVLFLGFCKICPDGWQAISEPHDPGRRHAYPVPGWSGRTPCCGRTDDEVKSIGEFYAVGNQPDNVTCTASFMKPDTPAGEEPK